MSIESWQKDFEYANSMDGNYPPDLPILQFRKHLTPHLASIQPRILSIIIEGPDYSPRGAKNNSLMTQFVKYMNNPNTK